MKETDEIEIMREQQEFLGKTTPFTTDSASAPLVSDYSCIHVELMSPTTNMAILE